MESTTDKLTVESVCSSRNQQTNNVGSFESSTDIDMEEE